MSDPGGFYFTQKEITHMATTAPYTFKNSKGVTFYLYSNGSLYYFMTTQKAGALMALPAGFKVVETGTGHPVLKKA